jgi:hypothetical protein
MGNFRILEIFSGYFGEVGLRRVKILPTRGFEGFLRQYDSVSSSGTLIEK